ncbi:hypothetical protein J1N35_005167 [Gossypium stocksii]|uniref:Uncharacterized protein n=1 Tax=Gossypium stocksii TaxID=47602 RepID=A0A9D3WDD0_9ROSI|nr:hypothetical protein J1N35_005167 [Gossypium stocksii]
MAPKDEEISGSDKKNPSPYTLSLNNNLVCSHRNREGHDLGTCFQLIGYPDWWGNRPHSSAIGRGSGHKHNSSGGRDKGDVP